MLDGCVAIPENEGPNAENYEDDPIPRKGELIFTSNV